jgi:hypothetical protein
MPILGINSHLTTLFNYTFGPVLLKSEQNQLYELYTVWEDVVASIQDLVLMAEKPHSSQANSFQRRLNKIVAR